MTEQLSIAGWTRNQMIQNPDINFDQLVEAFDKTDFPKNRRPSKKEYLGQQRTILFDRWGIKSLNQLPKPAFGKINMSGMTRLYLDKHGMNSSYVDAEKFFAIDGLELHTELFRFAKKEYLKKKSPDDNQLNGPRAGKPEVVVEAPAAQNKLGRPVKSKMPNDMYFSMLLEGKKFIDKIGGIGPAKKILDLIEVIQSK